MKLQSNASAFWCHAELGPAHDDFTTTLPGQAVDWVRESVRDISATLDRRAFHTVWAFLGDHRSVQEATTALGRGEPYAFSVAGPVGRLRWTVHPASALPLATPCGRPPQQLLASRPLPTLNGAA